MLNRIRSRLTFANVTSVLALFIALGGVTYAAVKLPKNSVGSAQIKNNAVGVSEIKSGAVGTSEVKNASLLAEDFAAGQLPKGPPGPEGPRGERGEGGATNVTIRTATNLNGSGGVFASKHCEPGERAVGGGGWATTENAFIFQSRPVIEGGSSTDPGEGDTPVGWRVGAQVIPGQGTSETDVVVYVICASP
jgi:hypothetical protein